MTSSPEIEVIAILGGVVSTRIVLVTVAVLPAGSVAVSVMVCSPSTTPEASRGGGPGDVQRCAEGQQAAVGARVRSDRQPRRCPVSGGVLEFGRIDDVVAGNRGNGEVGRRREIDDEVLVDGGRVAEIVGDDGVEGGLPLAEPVGVDGGAPRAVLLHVGGRGEQTALQVDKNRLADGARCPRHRDVATLLSVDVTSTVDLIYRQRGRAERWW